MREHRKKAQAFGTALIIGALAALGFAGTASAHEGEWAKFNYCPSTTEGVKKCLQAVVSEGEVDLGKKKVPVVNPVTLQGGLSRPSAGFRTMYAATNGETLTKTPQPVPGGLSGLVNCKAISNWLVRISCETVFENGLTGLDATLELAKPASEVRVSELNLAFEEGTAMELPVKVHLENPFLGSSCYIGSSSAPLMWNLTTGETSPPEGTEPIFGSGGEAEFKEEGAMLQINGVELADNAWSAPAAHGCGGFLIEYLINPIVNASVGLPAAAGENVAILDNTISLATAAAVNSH